MVITSPAPGFKALVHLNMYILRFYSWFVFESDINRLGKYENEIYVKTYVNVNSVSLTGITTPHTWCL